MAVTGTGLRGVHGLSLVPGLEERASRAGLCGAQFCDQPAQGRGYP